MATIVFSRNARSRTSLLRRESLRTLGNILTRTNILIGGGLKIDEQPYSNVMGGQFVRLIDDPNNRDSTLLAIDTRDPKEGDGSIHCWVYRAIAENERVVAIIAEELEKYAKAIDADDATVIIHVEE